MTGLHYPSIVVSLPIFSEFVPLFLALDRTPLFDGRVRSCNEDGRMTNPSPLEFAIDVTNRSYAQRQAVLYQPKGNCANTTRRIAPAPQNTPTMSCFVKCYSCSRYSGN